MVHRVRISQKDVLPTTPPYCHWFIISPCCISIFQLFPRAQQPDSAYFATQRIEGLPKAPFLLQWVDSPTADWISPDEDHTLVDESTVDLWTVQKWFALGSLDRIYRYLLVTVTKVRGSLLPCSFPKQNIWKAWKLQEYKGQQNDAKT